ILGQVDNGNLTKQENWKEGTQYIDVEKTYNSYGLITQEKDPLDNATNYTYDSYNLYPATVTNPLNQVTSYEYDYSAGKIKQATDVNGYIFKTIYDAFDRVKEKQQPDLINPNTLVVSSSYTYNDLTLPRSITQTNYLDGTNNFNSVTYLDGLDRVIQTRTKSGEVNIYSVKDTKYNSKGLVKQESLPYFSAGSARTPYTTNSNLYINYTYDSLNRAKTISDSVGTTTNVYNDWKTTTTDAENKVKSLYNDAYDNLVQVDEYDGANIYSTKYNYDLKGNLIKITDALNNIRNFQYDNLGRLILSEDSHSITDSTFGVISYTYNNNGNVLSKTDAKNQITNYAYDNLNRVLSEDYIGNAGIETTYAYDTCTGGVGKLCSVITSAVSTAYTYNPLGSMASENKNIDNVNYLTSFKYDRLGNNTSIIYPDNSEVKYEYNNGGLLNKVSQKEQNGQSFSSLLENIKYNPAGQTTYQDFANGTTSSYTYNPDSLYRLVNKITTGIGNVSGYQAQATSVIRPEDIRFEHAKELVATNRAKKDKEGNILLNDEIELKSERTKKSETYLLGFKKDGRRINKVRLYDNDVYYNDNAGKLAKIDTNFKEDKKNISMNKAQYNVSLNKDGSDKLIEFKWGANKLYISPIGNNNFNNPKVKDNQVVYKDLIAKGVDLKLTANNVSFAKEVVINSEESLTNLEQDDNNYYLTFKLEAKNLDVLVDEKLLSEEKNIISKKQAELIFENSDKLYISLPAVYDDAFTGRNIDIKYELKDGGVYLTKILPKSYFSENKLTYPVKTDAILNINYSGRGAAGNISTPWSTTRNAVYGNYRNDNPFVMTKKYYGGNWEVDRAFLSFNTSSIPQNANIVSANLYTYISKIYNFTFDAYSYYTVVQAWPQSLTIMDTDFGKVDDNELINPANRIICPYAGECYPGAYVNTPLSPTFFNLINRGAYTKLAIREGHDLENNVDSFNAAMYTNANYMSLSGSYLEIQYSLPLAPYSPTDLQANGKMSPAPVDSSVNLSAIYNDPQISNNALYYQIQVSNTEASFTTPLWDSGKKSLSTPLLQGKRSENIVYTGPAVTSGNNYYWRMKFWDSDSNEGEWSNGYDYFYKQGDYINFQNLNYTYDKVGNITKIIDSSQTDAAKTVNYTYDNLYRLTSAIATNTANNQNYSLSYSYDPIGNLLNKSDLGNYLYQGNQGASYANPNAATSINGITNAYDNNGNLLSNGTWTHSWDYRDRLIQSTNGTANISYAYDNDVNRIKYSNGTETTIYPNKYYNISSTGKITKHIFASGQALATIETDGGITNTYYIHSDHLGGTNVVSNSNGQLEQLLDYYPFGEIRISTPQNTFTEKRGYTGHEHDEDTNLEYMMARY
ncbi:MAG: hypothetical protein MUF50_01650, partial [Planctomycetes bacterium]|nr:hypothetical protein [Planctomycetota bacterium]